MILANVPSQGKMLIIEETMGEEIDALSAQYFCKYKTALINEVYLLKSILRILWPIAFVFYIQWCPRIVFHCLLWQELPNIFLA